MALACVVSVASPVLAEEEIKSECKVKQKMGVAECDAKWDKMNPPGPYPCNVDEDATCGLCCLLNTVYIVTNWIFFLMMALAVVLIVIGGATYMLAGGDPAKAGKGKTIITYAIIGLAIALVARFVPSVVKFIMGVS